MAETARAGTGTGPGGGTGGPTDGAKEKAKQAAGDAKEQAKEQAQQVAGHAKGRVSSEVDRRSTEAGERVVGQASDLRSVGEQLREQGKEGPAKIADQVAERAERLGNYLQRSDGDTLLGDLEDFGRRNPWVVIAGGVVLGIAASRFIKASSSERYERRRQGAGTGPYETRALPSSAETTGGMAPAYGAAGGGLGTPVPGDAGGASEPAVGPGAPTPGTAAATPVGGSQDEPRFERDDPTRPAGGL
jgi:hypothetical protein